MPEFNNIKSIADRLNNSEVLPSEIARLFASEYANCRNCQIPLKDDISGGQEIDRDVFFPNITCSECEAEQSVLVEEKVWGIVGNVTSALVPECADTFEYTDKYNNKNYLYINPNQIMVSKGHESPM